MVQLFIVILILVVYLELLYHQDMLYVFGWIKKKPHNVLMNGLLFLSIFSMFHLLFTESIAAFFMMLVAFGIGYGNKYKVLYRGDNLYPWDMGLGKESSDMKAFLDKKALQLDILIAITSILFVVGLILDQNISTSTSLVMLGSGLLALLLSLLFHKRTPVIKQHQFYSDKGLLYAFVLNIKEMVQHFYNKPSEVKASASSSWIMSDINTGDKQPSVIVVMNESFWDPSRMPGVHFSEPLTPHLETIRQHAIYGDLVSPEFGGGTSNTEYEFLSGNSMFFHPTGTMAFKTYIHKEIDSIPRQLKKVGYKTMALHSYKRWFWNRENVYRHMGLDDFWCRDSFDNPEIKGHYISDMALSEKIIDIYNQKDGPLFLFGVTMQNHGPYRVERYPSYDIEVSGKLDERDKGELQCYAQGVVDADKALGRLVEFFDKQEEEVFVVFFGDHLPMLGTKFSMFKNCDYIQTTNPLQWNEEEKLKMSSLPFVLWSNKKLESKNIGAVSPAKIGLELMKLLPVEMSPYFETLNKIYESHPIINKRIHEPNIETKVHIEHLDLYRDKQMKMLYGND